MLNYYGLFFDRRNIYIYATYTWKIKLLFKTEEGKENVQQIYVYLIR